MILATKKKNQFKPQLDTTTPALAKAKIYQTVSLKCW